MTLGERIKTCRKSSENDSKEASEQHMDEDKNKLELSSLLKKKYLWLVLIPVCAILCFLIWQIGPEIGADLGEFIYNIRN